MPTQEDKAREQIDQLLIAAGWVLQDRDSFDRNAALGVAVREFSLPSGFCDYLLFIAGKAAGVIEAKKSGVTLSGVAEQSEKYMLKLPEHLARWDDLLIYDYESTGDETFFRNLRDPKARSRRVFAFHRPETLHDWVRQPETLRARLKTMPPLDPRGLRDCQVEAINGLDASLAEGNPQIGETVCDPACGTGGFLLAAYDHMKTQTQDRERLRALRHTAFTGVDIVDEVVRLCAMNLYLHGVGNGGSPVVQGDALANDGGKRFKIVLTNPPFGKKSSYKVVGEDGSVTTERESYEREDFKFTTSNKQFNFLQHIMTILEANGRAGVVLPDNVLFEAGRAGEGIRKRLLEGFNFHTLLRLPTGIWYSPGVKANVLFFDKRPASRDIQTKALWVYDYRTNVHKTLKTKRLAAGDFNDFVRCYHERNETERFRRFPYEELAQRDKLNLDIFWLKDDSLEDIDNLPEPDVLSAEIVENLEAALEQFRSVSQELAGEVE